MCLSEVVRQVEVADRSQRVRRRAYRQVKGRLDLTVHDLGATQLKNIADPVRVYSLKVGQPAQAKPAPAPAPEKSAPPRLSMVVLPFANIGGDAEQEHFVDGVSRSPLEPRGDIDAVAHQIAVGLLDDIAEVDADAELDASLDRHAGVPLHEAVLHLDGAAHGVDHASEFNERAVAGAFDDAPSMHGDGRVDQIAAQRTKSGKRAILVRAGEPAVADHIGDQDRRYLALAMFRCHVGFPPVPVDK